MIHSYSRMRGIQNKGQVPCLLLLVDGQRRPGVNWSMPGFPMGKLKGCQSFGGFFRTLRTVCDAGYTVPNYTTPPLIHAFKTPTTVYLSCSGLFLQNVSPLTIMQQGRRQVAKSLWTSTTIPRMIRRDEYSTGSDSDYSK